jgi:hypothetical protein
VTASYAMGAQGLSNVEIADRLVLSSVPSRPAWYREMQKLGVKHCQELRPAAPGRPAAAENGEGGIRTRDRGFPPYSLSRRVPSATRPPLRRARGILEQGRAAHGAAADRSCGDGPSYHRAGPRRGGRVVECTGLENRRARKGSAGSNPAPSVSAAALGSRPSGGKLPPCRGGNVPRVRVVLAPRRLVHRHAAVTARAPGPPAHRAPGPGPPGERRRRARLRRAKTRSRLL